MTYRRLQIRGADAPEFLQGQLTNDLQRLEEEASIRVAWCNPKGRVIFLATLHRDGDGYYLDLPADLAEAVQKRLTMFRFRAAVELTLSDAPDGVGDAAWRREQLLAGIAEIGAQQTEQFTPHMLNLDLLDTISLDKGCYTGQEVVARTHYKGKSKRRLFRFRSAAPAKAGERVQLDGRDVGTVVNALDNELLAVVPVTQANDSLSVNGQELQRIVVERFESLLKPDE